LLGLSTYLARICPYIASFSALTAPTKMGTIFTWYLHQYLNFSPCCIASKQEALYNKTYPSNTLARYGRCISMLCSASSTRISISSNFPVALSSSITGKTKS